MDWKKGITACILLLFLLSAVLVVGYWKQEGMLVFGKMLEEPGVKKVALTFDDDVIIGLSQEISCKEAVSMI